MSVEPNSATPNALRATVLVLAGLASMGTDSCGTLGGSDLLTNSSFDRWCGDVPCDWEHEGRSVDRVPTWHLEDYGVRMLTGTTLRQRAASVDGERAITCLAFEILASAPEDGVLVVELDFDGDRKPEWRTEKAFSDWETWTFAVEPPFIYDSMHVTLREAGERNGTVVGHARAVDAGSTDECGDQVYLESALGEPCKSGKDCISGLCIGTHETSYDDYDYDTYYVDGWLGPFDLPSPACSACETDLDCTGGLVCGVVYEGTYGHRECVEPGATGLGEACLFDGECATGNCCSGRCSECCSHYGYGCGDDEQCVPVVVATRTVASVCEGPGKAGTPCLSDIECEGDCVGESLLLCGGDGRTCMSDEDCPLKGDSCNPYGVRDGVCQ